MQPESSDGFASVGTVLPKEEAALLPGGLFIVRQRLFRPSSACFTARFFRLSSLRFCRITTKPVEWFRKPM
jgi:hypothetical protein